MTLSEISELRLINQQITGSEFNTAGEIVHCMGAMQAQDFIMAKWAIGVRLPGSTEKMIETSFNEGKILRTHLLRPTWHFVASGDLYDFLNLTSPRIKAAMRSRDKQLELDETIYKKCNNIIEKVLKDGSHLTRDELMSKLQAEKINTSDNRSSHILMRAELDGVICSGALKSKKQTYALLSYRVPKITVYHRDEVLTKLALAYFNSHGPATWQDFAWWSGLSVAEARHGLEMVKTALITETVAGQEFWFKNPVSARFPIHKTVTMLPAYDEFLISYRDRSASLPTGYQPHTVSNNGIFRPIILADAQVAGLWNRNQVKNGILVETRFFHPPTSKLKQATKKALIPLEKFLGKKIVMSETNNLLI